MSVSYILKIKFRSAKPPRAASFRRAGFTLLEVLVAMVILSMLIVMIGNIFQQVSDSWNIGTQSADANNNARAALNFIANELAQAVAGPVEVVPGIVTNDVKFSLSGGNDLRFVTLSGEPDASEGRRALRRTSFYFDNNCVNYSRQNDNPYTNEPCHSPTAVLITNVVDFQALAYLTTNDLMNGNAVGAVPATNRLPVCVDLFLSVLSADDMQRWEKTGRDLDFRDKNAQSYATRVYLQNRGWAADP